MQISQFPIIFERTNVAILGLMLVSLAIFGCESPRDSQELLRSEHQISYPFGKPTEKLGEDPQADRFVIRSVKGNAEYAVEIPYAAEDYNIAIPMQTADKATEKKDPQNPQITDRELLGSMPKPNQERERERAMLDEAMGVESTTGSAQGPSYSLGLVKVVELYKSRQFEVALIEVNQLLSYYPQSARLFKMKGSIYNRTGDLILAEKAWHRALELDPHDKTIAKSLERLKRKIEVRNRAVPPGETED